jgi:hypothetical protein
MHARALICIVVAVTIVVAAAAYQIFFGGFFDAAGDAAPPMQDAMVPQTSVSQTSVPQISPGAASLSDPDAEKESLLARDGSAAIKSAEKDQARLEPEMTPVPDIPPAPNRAMSKLDALIYYPYAEILPKEKPAEIVLASLDGVPVGTPVEEIKRAADVFHLDFSFMKAVAKIESDFDPKQRTGSYIGLFQLNRYEFNKYGTGDIVSPRDNAIAAAYKFLSEAMLFQWDTRKKPTYIDLYMIHQQGWQGAAEHVAHPERIAWKSMCATDEGREKGEKWCKRAVWGNTLPSIKHFWKSVDNMMSGAFVGMWRERIDSLYARYSASLVGDASPKK